ncbi:MAG: glycosyltransferase family 4 protein [Flavobacteriales bacterium]|nr:glycosyltransferase family 4 protein [Flavobacteriales bacterium]
MPSILFIASHRPGRSPSQRYRFEQFVPYWEEHGVTVRYAWIIDEEDDKVFYTNGRLLEKARIFRKSLRMRREHVRMAKDFDLVFVQREALMTGSIRFERALAATGKPLIYDFDDAIWHMDVSEGNRRLRWLKDPAKTPRIIALATHVIAGNEYLAEYARQHSQRVEVIPTVIDTERYKPVQSESRADGKVIIGWTGSLTSTPHLRTAIPMLQELQAELGSRIAFRFISDRPVPVPGLDIEQVLWRADTEPEDLAPIGIGIMPLPDNEWSRGKCGFKGLQYMGMGKAVVLSRVGVNTSIVQEGVNGCLAGTMEEWKQKLRMLVADADLRRRLGAEARRTVEQHYSTVAWRDHYLRLFTDLTRRT